MHAEREVLTAAAKAVSAADVAASNATVAVAAAAACTIEAGKIKQLLRELPSIPTSSGGGDSPAQLEQQTQFYRNHFMGWKAQMLASNLAQAKSRIRLSQAQLGQAGVLKQQEQPRVACMTADAGIQPWVPARPSHIGYRKQERKAAAALPAEGCSPAKVASKPSALRGRSSSATSNKTMAEPRQHPTRSFLVPLPATGGTGGAKGDRGGGKSSSRTHSSFRQAGVKESAALEE